MENAGRDPGVRDPRVCGKHGLWLKIRGLSEKHGVPLTFFAASYNEEKNIKYIILV